MEPRTRKLLALLACAGLLSAFLIQGWFFIRANSQTFDEAVHLAAGYSYLDRHDFRLNPEHPPLLKELAALPVYLRYHVPFRPPPHLWEQGEKWTISREFLYHSPVFADDLLTTARLPMLALGGLLVALTGWWAYRLWGEGAAVVATGLAAFEPNLIAHSCLIGTDVGSAFFIVLTLYLLWEYGQKRSLWLLAASGIALGLGLASKFSVVLLVGMGGVILLAHVCFRSAPLFPPRADVAPPRLAIRLKQAVFVTVCVAVLAAVVVLSAYFFQGWGYWKNGFTWQMTKGGQGHDGYFLGEYSKDGWLLYFPVAFLVKTPIGSIVLIAASLLLFRAGKRLALRDGLFLLVPVFVFLAVVIRGRINIGVRYLIPIYPFLFLLASRLATVTLTRRWLVPVLLGIALLGNAVSVLRIAPHDLAYFNELAGGPENGRHLLADSNLDWGQDLKGLKEYIDRENIPIIYLSYYGTALPEGYGIRYQEIPGGSPVDWTERHKDSVPEDGPQYLAVSVTNLQGVYWDPDEHGKRAPFEEFDSRKPDAIIGHSIYVYRLTGPLDRERLAEIALRGSKKRP
jgi:hypothetical protein